MLKQFKQGGGGWAARTIQMAHGRRMSQTLMNNQVTHNEYPRRRKISFDTKNYNAKGLLTAMQYNHWKVPHSRRNYSNEEILEIIARVVEPGSKKIVNTQNTSKPLTSFYISRKIVSMDIIYEQSR